jgi:hypothetical protein
LDVPDTEEVVQEIDEGDELLVADQESDLDCQ